MARRRPPKKMESSPDPVYGSTLVQMVVNRLMKQGKKPLAYRVCYRSMELLEKETRRDPLLLLEEAIRNVTPTMQVKAKRRGGSTYQVPVPVEVKQGTALAIRWILTACRQRSGKTMALKLRDELLDASKRMGSAMRKREEVNRMAEANKAFAKNRF
uniref:Small ribosomal subunit protein uS7c n=1 Tax=Elliptochloris antarctica TaxID=1844074 RepID=A0A0C5BUC3_ELLAN|nr:ribosomal protein S7 [Hemichloris antarctica]